MDGDIVGPDDLSLKTEVNDASGQNKTGLPEKIPDLKTGILAPEDQQLSMAERMTGPSRMDETLIDFMTRPDDPMPCGCKPPKP